jgi:sporulation protein YlmC with PRC-barrel domain
MIIVNSKSMAGVLVETRSGEKLGKVGSFNLDAATGHLISLEVKPMGIVAGIAGETLPISWDAIVEMTPEKVVVIDGAIKDAKPVPANSGPVISPTLMKE